MSGISAQAEAAIKTAPPFQFGLRALLTIMAVFAATLSFALYAGAIGALIALFFVGMIWLLMPIYARGGWKFWAAALLMHANWVACASVWHTHGEGENLAAWGYGIPIGFACLFLWALRLFRTALLLALLVIAPFCIEQFWEVRRLHRLQDEVLAFSRFLEDQYRITGKYPADMGGYSFCCPEYHDLLIYWPNGPDYVIGFDMRPGDMTSREYSPKNGWYYYPD